MNQIKYTSNKLINFKLHSIAQLEKERLLSKPNQKKHSVEQINEKANGLIDALRSMSLPKGIPLSVEIEAISQSISQLRDSLPNQLADHHDVQNADNSQKITALVTELAKENIIVRDLAVSVRLADLHDHDSASLKNAIVELNNIESDTQVFEINQFYGSGGNVDISFEIRFPSSSKYIEQLEGLYDSGTLGAKPITFERVTPNFNIHDEHYFCEMEATGYSEDAYNIALCVDFIEQKPELEAIYSKQQEPQEVRKEPSLEI